MVQGRPRLRSGGRRSGKTKRRRQKNRRALRTRVQLLPHRPLSGRQHAGQERGLPAFGAHVSEGGEILRSAARDRRTAVRGRKDHRLSATAARRDQAAGGDALGRRRRLEGRPSGRERGVAPPGARLARGRHAGHRRQSGALHRPQGRAHVVGVHRPPADAQGRRRHARRRVGRQLRRLLGGQDRIRRAPGVSRARCSTAATRTTASRRSGWCRR